MAARAARAVARCRGGAGGQAVGHLLEVGGERADPVEAGLLGYRLAGVGDALLRAGLLVDGEPVGEIGEQLLDPVGDGVELVAGVDLLAPPTILAGVRLGIANHALDLALVEVGAFGDRHLLLGAGGLISRRDVEDAVGVEDRKSTRLNSSHQIISYAVFCLKKKKASRAYALAPIHAS